jgi:hypothetical protein
MPEQCIRLFNGIKNIMIPKKIPGKTQRFQLSPCYIQQRMMHGDQHFVIPEATNMLSPLSKYSSAKHNDRFA